ncbi:unnamed protein product [Lactuca virosa]|uniref:Dof zinc finger protein n=1 Tax=Lactuca virosa TaxID=75947 RepID=A0AAU9NNU3_9ASTR|nr:unnamed protein product [Lactuca virosa]
MKRCSVFNSLNGGCGCGLCAIINHSPQFSLFVPVNLHRSRLQRVSLNTHSDKACSLSFLPPTSNINFRYLSLSIFLILSLLSSIKPHFHRPKSPLHNHIKMASDSSDQRRTTTAKNHHVGLGAPPSEPEHLPCPRCDSTNTKFCYYNNYNFSQPRHFCKSCRRYWTHGGALRDIPVGGGTRKNAKRARISTATSHDNSSVSSGIEYHHISATSTTTSVASIPILMSFAGDHGGSGHCGSFTSLLSNTQSPGLYGLDQDFSFGLGRTIWPFSSIGDGVVAGNAGSGGGGNTWQMDSTDGGGDYFVFPDLAISTPGNAMK